MLIARRDDASAALDSAEGRRRQVHALPAARLRDEVDQRWQSTVGSAAGGACRHSTLRPVRVCVACSVWHVVCTVRCDGHRTCGAMRAGVCHAFPGSCARTFDSSFAGTASARLSWLARWGLALGSPSCAAGGGRVGAALMAAGISWPRARETRPSMIVQ